MPHQHDSSCGAGCDHGQAGLDGEEMGVAYSLFQRIDMNKLTCLNETVDNSGRLVFKPWEARLDKTDRVDSDADEELLINIPFTGDVKLKGIVVIGGEDETHPDKVRLFKNRENMTFDDAGAPADQEFSLVRDVDGTVQYKTKVVTFSSVHHLTLHFPSNYGDDSTRIYYIGLAGEFTQATRVGVVNAVYEARAVPGDHKQKEEQGGMSQGFGY